MSPILNSKTSTQASISVIIPVINEAGTLPVLLNLLSAMPNKELLIEIIIADGGSTDSSIEIAYQFGARVVNCAKGRAKQLNAGAMVARGTILYFLHADTFPPKNAWTLINDAIQTGNAGCFRLRFNRSTTFLKANAWFTRFDIDAIRFGDQSLFMKKKVFDSIGGYDERHLVFEDQEIVKRIKKQNKFIVLPAYVITSSRKYIENGQYKLQTIFFLICLMYHFGFSQTTMVHTYRKLVNSPNI